MVAAPNPSYSSTQPDSHYKQLWIHERNRRMEVEQENIKRRKIVYNTQFSITERAVALEIVDQVKEAKHVDEQGRKLFSRKQAAVKLGCSPTTIGTAVDVLEESGFIPDKSTTPLRGEDGEIVKDKKGNPIHTTHLAIDQELLEDFSKAERVVPRKIGKNRKTPVYQCQKCLTEDVTIETSRHLVCKNPDCDACGKRVLIDIDYKDQLPEDESSEDFSTKEPPDSDQNLDTIELMDNSDQNLDTIELMDNSDQNLDTIELMDESNNPPPTVSSPA